MGTFIILAIVIAILTLLLDEYTSQMEINNNKRKSREVNNLENQCESIYKKDPFMNISEIKFYNMLVDILKDDGKYIVIPQVSLRKIINTNDNKPFHTELNRYIDFGIFKRNNFELILLIEINGNTHLSNQITIDRDKKVKEICNIAGYTLINFWLDKPNEFYYVKNRIYQYIQNVENKANINYESKLNYINK